MGGMMAALAKVTAVCDGLNTAFDAIRRCCTNFSGQTNTESTPIGNTTTTNNQSPTNNQLISVGNTTTTNNTQSSGNTTTTNNPQSSGNNQHIVINVGERTSQLPLVGSVTAAVLAAVIAAYLTHPLWKKGEDGSTPTPPQTTPRAPPTPPPAPPPTPPPAQMEIITKIGPWGYPGKGDSFDHRGYDGIKTIQVYCSAAIDCIRVQYTRRGDLVWSPRVGANTSVVFEPSHELVLEDGEHITNIVGYYGTYCGIEVVIGLKFYTNINQDPQIWGRNYAGVFDNGKELEPIRFVSSGGKIVGFHGTAGKYIFSIGVYVCPDS